MTWPALLLWLIFLLAALQRGSLVIYLFSATMIFGSITMLPPGRLNLPPQTVSTIIFIGSTFVQRRNLVSALTLALDVRRLGFLLLFLLCVVPGAIILPRLFSGLIAVVPLDNTADGVQPIVPTSANLTQAIYITVSVGTAFAFAVRAHDARFRAQYLRSIWLTGWLLVASGVIDLCLTLSGHTSLLSPFHNAHYALLSDVMEAGQLRVVGFMPEASAYGAACVSVVSVLIFCFNEFNPITRRFSLPLVIASLIAMIYLSTSSTGFVGFIIIAAIFLTKVVLRFLVLGRIRLANAIIILGAVATISAVYLLCMTFDPSFIAATERLLNAVLFDKTQSSSYVERSSWTHAGFEAFIHSYGIGVGVGSVRTSNWLVNLLASTGIIGTTLLGAAIMVSVLAVCRQRSTEKRRFGYGLVLATVPIGAMMVLSGTTPDPGAFNMAILGLLTAAGRTQRTHTEQQISEDNTMSSVALPG